MAESPMHAQRLVPYFAYEDAATAIRFLETAFGFRTNARYDADDGSVTHAELDYEGAVVMLGTGADGQRDADRWSAPASRGVYVVVDGDLDAHFERARSAGARVVWEPHDTEFGTRRYRVLDSEGYEWSFGSYRPSSGDA